MKWYHWILCILAALLSTLVFFNPDFSRKLRAVKVFREKDFPQTI